MPSIISRNSLTAFAAVLGILCVPAIGVGADNDERTVEIRGGTAAFDASTNVSAISIHGKSTSLKGRAQIRRTTDGLVISRIEAVVPVQTLNTGLALRDDHMRKRVFETSPGVAPDLRFVGENIACEGAGDAKTCRVAGSLLIRDTPRPFSINLRVSDKGHTFHVSGQSVVRLSAYGITPPSQLGVTTADDVALRIEFVGKTVAELVATTAEKG
jgi:polyisoprenoid-binding protein YceI